jgi:hypothetical protein
MQGKNHSRLNSLWITGLLLLLAVPGAAAEQGADPDATSVTAHPVGLVVDSRANAYTVDRVTGKVFCLLPGNEPIHYATISGEPTTLAVDRRRTLFIGTATGHILAVLLDGTVCAAFRCPHSVTGLAVDRDGGLLITTGNGTLVKVRRAELVMKRVD